ncbi:flagellar hook-associated protein 3 [Cryobacterium sp. TmT2-59]|uniref:Flagellar hook-associated protein 3 n=1 Tax=Cryobacterium shii TaxID=1259235 RepID=A0AAQ2C8R3_9MICO|nr:MULTISPECIES: flagellar hook-associated protein FlgL [Cryobacterium]TFC52118.1 flagellar hook-associated protein 3 [Cryobacterium shii]TFC84671.1 flagellar hook-associated protein 3 [Cryobacterium sp. TmT2-59]TFD16264.1 flagellar hook-associated protein 3 [Cryobacterium sp. TMT2-23]TFD19068.1 flagellar hook-associated protein 3 [Cryobacterium sp. TMT4-10]
MIARVTTSTQMRSAQSNLQTNLARMAQLQERASSLKAIERPSDDPARAADALAVRAEQRAVTQYSRNADNGNGWLTSADTALGATTDLLNRVRDLTLQGVNDILSPTAKEAIAAELDSLKQDLLAQANTAYLGRTVFAGSSDAGVAFKSDFSFTGVAGATVERRIGADTTVAVNADGAAIFGATAENPVSVFDLLTNISAALRGTATTPPANVGPFLTAVDSRMKTVLSAQADVGVRQAQIQKAGDTLVQRTGALEAQRSSIEDVDLGQAILDLKLQEVTYQSALAVTAKVLQPTLMDFLR